MRLRAWPAKALRAWGVTLDPQAIKRALGPLCVGPGLIVDGLQVGHTLPEHRVGYVSYSVLDGVVEPLELGFRLGRTLAQFSNMVMSGIVYIGREGGQSNIHANELPKTTQQQ